MSHHCLLGVVILAAVLLAGVTCKPSSNEAMTPLEIDIEDPVELNNEKERSLTYEEESGVELESSNTKDIIEKIKAVNDGLKTPVRRPPLNYNTQPMTGGGYIIDKEILDKIQQIITAGKLNPLALTHKYQESNTINNDDLGGPRNARTVPGLHQRQLSMTSLPYITSMPVIVMPSPNNNMFNGDLNTLDISNTYQTRQSPALPFGLQWPLAPFFPILIRDPLLNFMGGGSWNNLVDFGQSADVCNRKQKSNENEDENENSITDTIKTTEDETSSSRQARAVKKRTISSKSSIENNLENLKKVKKFFTPKLTTKKPSKPSSTYIEEEPQDTKTTNSDDGDLRFPFGDFSWFGNKKPVAPSPGFFINRLKVRRGGVAIAGPGGVATAGRGGTAIVGPGGLAYTQPGGLAVAGPSARIIALSPETDLSSVVARLQEQSATDGSVPRLLEAIPEGKVVATGPIVYYHPIEQTFQRGRWGDSQRDNGRKSFGFSRRSDEYQYNGSSFIKGPWMAKDSFVLFLKPTAHATNSHRGVAVANPISNVVVSRNDLGSIVHAPVASAIVGPGGIAHAQSDLNLYEYYSY